MFSLKRHKVERLNFIVAGAQKSGTTALRYFLKQHSQIVLPDRQELHFFDDEEIFSGPVDYELLHRHFRGRAFRGVGSKPEAGLALNWKSGKNNGSRQITGMRRPDLHWAS